MELAVINVQFMDNACFAWAVIVALCPADKNADRQSSYPYYISVLNMQDIEFPMRINQIKKFERLNDISINIHSAEKRYDDATEKEGNVVVPIRFMEYTRDDNFARIKNLSRLVSSQLSKKSHKKHICDRFLHYFSSSEKLESRTVDYQKMNDCAIILPNDDNKWLSFTNYCRKERVPFVVYADLECTLEKTPREEQTKQWEIFRNATLCHVCEKSFAEDDARLRDHCHLTGRYRGPAYSNCNLNYQDSYCIPVAFHNLSGYDSHFIIKDIATMFEGSITVLPITKEKYISFTKTVGNMTDSRNKWINCLQLRFIDSYKFLCTSLDKLASFLDKDKLKIVLSEFSNLSDKDFDLLTRKGVFPYEYLDCVDKLQDQCLSPRESFDSSLTGDTVSESDYAHAANI
ncbi:uncharacterized protein LOC112588726 [Harpegnathos saltator]|uniref:uncharacterized protein LOC112588723 n=1 Tax=Harpegnathos saltator TaxID=610380 RepID=UPI000DBED55C|nr:uncharacterized protein LOC112588723 [Harpegnathos saltator]XP_025155228.1 uncharacterized protein LOC112588726 [Harpegnathos saltator]